nr:hypothetical protein [Sandaracinobacteroides saxicola]
MFAPQQHVGAEAAVVFEVALVGGAPGGERAIGFAFGMGKGVVDVDEARLCDSCGFDERARVALPVEDDLALTYGGGRIGVGRPAGGGLGAGEDESEECVRHFRTIAEGEALQGGMLVSHRLG